MLFLLCSYQTVIGISICYTLYYAIFCGLFYGIFGWNCKFEKENCRNPYRSIQRKLLTSWILDEGDLTMGFMEEYLCETIASFEHFGCVSDMRTNIKNEERIHVLQRYFFLFPCSNSHRSHWSCLCLQAMNACSIWYTFHLSIGSKKMLSSNGI